MINSRDTPNKCDVCRKGLNMLASKLQNVLESTQRNVQDNDHINLMFVVNDLINRV